MENDLYQQAESADEYLDFLTLENRIYSLLLSTLHNNTNSNNNDNKTLNDISSISIEGIDITSGSSIEGSNITSGSKDISTHSSMKSNRITERENNVVPDSTSSIQRTIDSTVDSSASPPSSSLAATASTVGINIISGSKDISIQSSTNSNRITKRKKIDSDDDDDRNYNTGTLLKK
jgi:hypothetical protein